MQGTLQFLNNAPFFSDNFFTQMYLVLFNPCPFPTFYQFTVYLIYELLYPGSAQSLPVGKQFQLWLANINTAYSTVVFNNWGGVQRSHPPTRSVSHMKARPTRVVKGCNLFPVMQIRCSIWGSSKVSVQFPVFGTVCMLLQWREDYAPCVFNNFISFEELYWRV